MKQLFLLAILLSASGIKAQERVQEFSRSYPADRFQELSILNRLGNVDIRQGGDQFEIQAEIKVKAKTMEKVDEVMQYLRVDVAERGSVLNASTVLEKEFTIKRLFFGVSIEVDYHVKIPKGKKLSVANKDGSVLMGNFSGDLNVEVISGDFKARQVEGEFTAKLKDGFFDAREVNRLVGEFESAEVKINRGQRVKLTGIGSKIELMNAGEVIAKASGGSLYLGNVETVELHAAGAKCEIQDVSGSLRADTRSGGLLVHSINQFFSAVDVTSTDTRVTLAFRPGGGFSMNFKHDNIKIEIPKNYALEVKPTTDKKVFIESGFVGDTRYKSQVSLNLTGGRLVIQ
jgi:hypothetical protein